MSSVTKEASDTGENRPPKSYTKPMSGLNSGAIRVTSTRVLTLHNSKTKIIPSAEKTVKSGLNRRASLDIVTGRELRAVYFDPKACSEKVPVDDETWLGANLFVPAAIVKSDEASGLITVKLPSGELYRLNNRSLSEVNHQDEEGIEDILKLTTFSEMSFLHTLRVRYSRDEIYTFAGPILISMNPYKKIPSLYEESKIIAYHTAQRKMAPHLYVIAEAAYASLMNGISSSTPMDQAIIISGESGAGKTESTKVIMSYLAKITTLDTISREGVGDLEQKVLNTNPILEAFGNAKTLRNDNSSRFGKFIKIQFDCSGRIVGAIIEKYLLEKTRVQHQQEGERNFHVFYQLLSGLSSEERSQLFLSGPVEDFKYLSDPRALRKDIQDSDDFLVTRMCFEGLNIDADTIFNIWRLLIAILYMGNINFVSKDDHVSGVDDGSMEALARVSILLGLESQALISSLTTRNMHVGGSVIVQPQSQSQALEKRDSFSKTVFSMLFTWLVEKINAIICCKSDQVWGNIAVLDIYGFENFENSNGFEQLLINYANEKLQNHFNRQIFLIEQLEYEEEGIDWSYITFNDNRACVELIEGKPDGKSGIFQTLDDAITTVRGDPNAAFISQLNLTWGTGENSHYLCPRFNSDQKFGILHYAGEVFYEIASFSEKNRDGTNNDMKDLLAGTSNPLLKEIVKVVGASGDCITSASAKSKRSNSGPSKVMSTRSKLKEDSISKQFSASLKQLYDTLDSMQPHFVRCIKPNNIKVKSNFNSSKILEQLKCAGMMETIRIRRQGYALRQYHADFFSRYLPLSPRSKTLKDLVDVLSRILKASNVMWQLGTSKVFFRREMSEKLEQLLYIRYSKAARDIQKCWNRRKQRIMATKIQSNFRRYHIKSFYASMRRSSIKLQSFFRKRWCLIGFKRMIKSLVSIQRIFRLWILKARLRQKQNPFHKIEYQELILNITNTQRRMQAAFSAGEFKECESLQNLIDDMKVALALKPIPEYVPVNVAEYELYLLESNLRFDHASGKKNMSLCSALRGRIRKIEESLTKFPSVESIDADINATKTLLEQAISAKDFRKCSHLQTAMAQLETKREVAVLSLPLQNLNMKDLEDRKSNLEVQISTLSSDRHFEKCSVLQVQIASVEKEIYRRSMPRDTILENINLLEAELDIAKVSENFLLMAEIQIQLKYFKSLLSSTRASTAIISTSFTEVQEAIIKIESDMQVALSKNDYNLCSEIQKDLDQLYSQLASFPASQLSVELSSVDPGIILKKIEDATSLLKACLKPNDSRQRVALEEKLKVLEMTKAKISSPIPVRTASKSKSELQDELTTVRLELEDAVKKRSFKLCLQLNGKIRQLEEDIEKLPSASSILRSISEHETKLSVAIRERNFHLCNEIEEQIRILRSQFDTLPVSERCDKDSGFTEDIICVSSEHENNHVQENRSISEISTDNRRSVETDRLLCASNSDVRPVSRLRPRAPVIANDTSSVFEIAKLMMKNRTDAVLLIDGSKGSISGIITDNDITRRVVAKDLDPKKIGVNDVMTKSPMTITMESSGLGALEVMIDNHFRHLPVVDSNGKIDGILDIAKCIIDAISVLEKAEEDGEADMRSVELKKVMDGMINQVDFKRKKKLIAMQDMMKSMFGSSIPTIRDLLSSSSSTKSSSQVQIDENIRRCAMLMASAKKGLLIMNKEELVGIFTPLDLVHRVIGKGLSVDDVCIADVMTSNPDCISAESTVLDALRELKDQKYLHLPVKDNTTGTILGIVDVVDLLTHSAGEDSYDTEIPGGWRALFKRSLSQNVGDTSKSLQNKLSGGGRARSRSVSRSLVASDSNNKSHNVTPTRMSRSKSISRALNDIDPDISDQPRRSRSKSISLAKGKCTGPITSSDEIQIAPPIPVKPVSKLRPKMPVIKKTSDNVYDVILAMAKSRNDAALIVDDADGLIGIVTDNDITKRVVSKFIDPSSILVQDIMTKRPISVYPDSSALDALELMVDNRFRHLPVVNSGGTIVGLIDIAKCIYDAISALEKVEDDNDQVEAENVDMLNDALSNTMRSISKGKNKESQLKSLKAMLENMFSSGVPTLRSIVDSSQTFTIRSSCNVREASMIMAETGKAVLVIEDEEIVGIFSPKDIINRVLSQGKSPDLTALSSVMTLDPDCANADITLLDALRDMHDHKYLHLPVKDISGKVLGIVNVSDLLIHSAGDGSRIGWRDFFRETMDVGRDGDTNSVGSFQSSIRGNLLIDRQHPFISSTIPSNFVFKVTDSSGNIHRIKPNVCEFVDLKQLISEKLGLSQNISIKYADEDGELCVLSSDLSLVEAIETAIVNSKTTLKLFVSDLNLMSPVGRRKRVKDLVGGEYLFNNNLYLIGAAALGVATLLAFSLMRD